MHTLKNLSHQRSWRFRRLPARLCHGTPPSLIGTATTATNTAGTVFSFTWTPTQAGTYVISAKATDNLNASTTTSTNQNRTVTVNALPNQAPVITLNAPTGGTGPNGSFTAPATISLNASASDADGSIAVVNFYQGATLIGAGTLTTGTSQNGTWTTSLSNVGQGSYTVNAIATDNAGASVTSAAIQITVNPGATGAAPGLYFIEVDHLNTPRRIANLSQQTVWKMDYTEAFGDSVPNENPSNLGTFEFNQRFPG